MSAFTDTMVLPVSSFILCAILTPCIRYAAVKKGWVAEPKEDRWHKTPTALMGGIAIYTSMAIPLILFADVGTFFKGLISDPGAMASPSLSTILLTGITFLFILGLVDDLYNIKPHTKLIGQIILAAFVTFLGYRLHWFTSLTLDTMVTMAWVVGITNAFNLLDNMDGLCAGVGTVCAISLSFLLFQAQNGAAIGSLIIAGSLTGFLIYNFNPAKIFMGDCGSLPIGFSIATLTLGLSEVSNDSRLILIAIPILVMMVPIFDTTLVTLIRLLSGRKASTGGRDHTSHRLVLMGFTEKQSVLFLYAVGALSGTAAVIVSRSDSLTTPVVLVPIGLSVILMGVYLAQLRVYPEKEFAFLREKSFTPILLDLTYKKQLLLVILDFCLISFSYYLAYRLRFDGSDFSYYFNIFLKSLPVVIGAKIIVFFLMGIYRGLWGNISTNEVFLYVKTSVLATILSVVGVTFIFRFEDFSKGVFGIDFILTTGMVIGVRGSFKVFVETLKRKRLNGKKVVIYGAGCGGDLLLREMLNNNTLAMSPIGFIDDDVLKKGKKLHGYPILGSSQDIESLVEKHGLTGVIISFNDGKSTARDRMRTFCRKHELFLKEFKMSVNDIV